MHAPVDDLPVRSLSQGHCVQAHTAPDRSAKIDPECVDLAAGRTT